MLATMFMLGKACSETGIALPEIMFWRQAVTVPLIPLWLMATPGGLGRLKTRRMGSHASRATVGMIGMACGFGANILLPLAEATTLSFTTPLFAVIIGAVFLREKVGPWRWSAVLLGFCGVLVISQPGHAPLPPLGAAVGLMAGLIVAIVSFQLRDLGRTEEAASTVFYFALFGALMMLPLLPFFASAHGGWQWLLLFGMGLSGVIGQLLITAALREGAVASVIVMDYTTLIWATLYGWLIWDHLPPLTTWMGAPAIIAAGMIVVWREQRLAGEGATPDGTLTATKR